MDDFDNDELKSMSRRESVERRNGNVITFEYWKPRKSKSYSPLDKKPIMWNRNIFTTRCKKYNLLHVFKSVRVFYTHYNFIILKIKNIFICKWRNKLNFRFVSFICCFLRSKVMCGIFRQFQSKNLVFFPILYGVEIYLFIVK